jgi:hypothetical protein
MHVVKILTVILASLAIMWLSFRQSGARWLRERHAAEESRAKMFDAIVQAGSTRKERLPNVLDCFARAHLDNQLAFFRKRGGQFDEAARKNELYRWVGRVLWAISALLALAAIAHLAAAHNFENPTLSTLSHWLRTFQLDHWHVGIDAMAASILAFASERSSRDRDTRTAVSYAEAARDLSAIRDADMQNAIDAATRGDDKFVVSFCRRIQAVLDAEHRAWRYM